MGDSFGMPIAHIASSGMGGIRTTGDLVAWMQLTRRMKIDAAKTYVAEKLKIDLEDLTNEDVIYPLRRELGIGSVSPVAGDVSGILAKHKIAQLLDIRIPSVDTFRRQLETDTGP